MTPFHSTSALLLLALALPVQAAEPYVPWPSKEKLREIQLAAYSCSRENDASDCSRARSLADPLMDHPRLPVVCKDVLWRLVETAKVAPANTYQRRDAIDLTPHQVCGARYWPPVSGARNQARGGRDETGRGCTRRA